MQQESTSLCDTKYKIVFLGNMGVGKTSIIERFVKDEFDPFNNVPIQIISAHCWHRFPHSQHHLSKYAFDHVDKTYRLQLWDTAGQEKYKSLVPAYLRDANCAVFVFDFSRKESLADLSNWIQLYRDHASQMSVGFILGTFLSYAGNKCDLLDEKAKEMKELTQSAEPCMDLEQEAKQFANKQNMTFRKVSAKNGKDVMSSFQNIISELQGGTRGANPQQEDPETRFQNEVLEKMDKLRLEDVKKGDHSTSCCYI